MTSNALQPDELVIRVIFRLPSEVLLPVSPVDFVRRRKVRPLNEPECGISLLRLSILTAFDNVYRYVGAYKKAMGVAEARLSDLINLGFKKEANCCLIAWLCSCARAIMYCSSFLVSLS